MLLLRRELNSNTRNHSLVSLIFLCALLCLMLIFALKCVLNISEIESSSKLHNSDLKQIIGKYLSDKSLPQDKKDGLINDIKAFVNERINSNSMTPTIEYEQLRRRVRSNILALHNYVVFGLENIRNKTTTIPKLTEYLSELIQMTTEQKRSLLSDMDQLQKNDGHEQWRKNEAKSLSDLVQRRLKYIQNPKNCYTAKKLVCLMDMKCGLGCELHHLVHCLNMAYATERTLILKSKGWVYNKNGWEEVFKPLSDTCTSDGPKGATRANWANAKNDTQILDLPRIGFMVPKPPQLPMAIPEDLAPRLKRLHGDPFNWWLGQLFKYLLRFQPQTEKIITAHILKIGFKKTFVGVHVRRTDKIGTEAVLHEVEEYMQYVDEYYTQLEMVQKVEKRRVFIASDEPKVIDEARTKYPNYEIIGDSNAARTAALSTRFTNTSLYGILFDLHLLSMSEYLVCTFSSNVGRLAYTLMQTMHPDASNRFKSLDSVYVYNGPKFSVAHKRKAVLPHHPKNHSEIELNVGDLIGWYNNGVNNMMNKYLDPGYGYSFGRNLRTNQNGLFPTFKVIDQIETAEFPKYSNIDET